MEKHHNSNAQQKASEIHVKLLHLLAVISLLACVGVWLGYSWNQLRVDGFVKLFYLYILLSIPV